MATKTKTTNLSPAARLAAIIAAGVEIYRDSLPDYAREGVEYVEPTPHIHWAISEERQRELCLTCPLADCEGVASARCPIRQASRLEWKRETAEKASMINHA